MQEIGEQLDSAILAYAILLQLMHCSIASCVLHIAYCILHIACYMLRWCKISLRCMTYLHDSIINLNFFAQVRSAAFAYTFDKYSR